MNNKWGTVCDDSWGSIDATVVCQQLDYSSHGQLHAQTNFDVQVIKPSIPTGALAFSGAHFGAGTGPIVIGNVACSGSESNLINCSHRSNVTCTNGHSQDAGVRCQGQFVDCGNECAHNVPFTSLIYYAFCVFIVGKYNNISFLS